MMGGMDRWSFRVYQHFGLYKPPKKTEKSTIDQNVKKLCIPTALHDTKNALNARDKSRSHSARKQGCKREKSKTNQITICLRIQEDGDAGQG